MTPIPHDEPDLKMAGGKQSVLVTSLGDGTAGKKRRHKKLH